MAANEVEITVRVNDQSQEGYRHANQAGDQFRQRTEQNLNQSGNRFGLLGKAAGLAGSAIKAGAVVGAAGLGLLGGFLVQGVKDAASYQVLAKKTAQVIESTGNAAHISVKGVQSLAAELESMSGVDEELIINSQNLLATFTNIKNVGKDKIFDMATRSVLDLSVAMDGDLKGASIQVGKALNDPIKGISALSKVGVNFTDTQKEVIKKLVETGDVAGAQKIILSELNKEFGGQAKAAGETFEGAMNRLKDALGDTGRAIGEKMLPKLTELADWATKKVPQVIDDLSKAWHNLTSAINGNPLDKSGASNLGVEIANLNDSLSGLNGAFTKSSDSATTWKDILGKVFDPARFTAGLSDWADIFKDIGLMFRELGANIQKEALTMVLGIQTAFGRLPGPIGKSFREAAAATGETLRKIQANLDDINADQMRSDIADARKDLRRLGQQKTTPKVRADIAQAEAKIRTLRQKLNSIPDERVNVYINNVVTRTENIIKNVVAGAKKKGNATGGVIGAAGGGPRSDWTMVGEQGRELVKLAPGSTVIPNGQTEAMMSGGGGGGGPMVLEIKSGGSRTDDFLVELIRRAIRARGGNVQSVLGS